MDETLRLFHGSRSGIDGAIAPKSRAECDFGKGFYLGTESSQPLTLICRSEAPRLYTCKMDLAGLKVHRFGSTIEWALFIAYCRKRMPLRSRRIFAQLYEPILRGNDVIFGKIANDKMFYVLDFFFDNLASDTAVLKCLSALNLGDQYCAKTIRACRAIKIVSDRAISRGECRKLQDRSDRQRRRATVIVDEIMDANRREGLLFREIIEQKARALSR